MAERATSADIGRLIATLDHDAEGYDQQAENLERAAAESGNEDCARNARRLRAGATANRELSARLKAAGAVVLLAPGDVALTAPSGEVFRG